MTLLTVGPDGAYRTIAAAVAASASGDTINVAAGTYSNDFVTISHSVTLTGVGGTVNMVATVPPPNGKAILDVSGDVTINNFAFSGAQVSSGNGAGIRYEAGNLTLNNDVFHDNQDGLLGAADPNGTITINNSEFAHNGAGDGYTHNLYVGDVASLTIDGSYFHDAVVGHEIKSRAESTTVMNSRIQDGPNGTASYSIDLPNGGTTLIQNDTIEKGPNAQNPILISYGEEGSLHAGASLTVTGDTILNDHASPSSLGVRNATSTTAAVSGDSVYGLTAAQLTSGPASVSGITTLAAEPALNTSSPSAARTPAASPAPAPAPVPAPVPAPAPTPSTDTLIVNVSEDAYQGDAQFQVSLDGKTIGQPAYATRSHAAGLTEAFTFTGSFGSGSHVVGVTFLNDKYDGTPQTDRNLYIDSVTYDGALAPNSARAQTWGGTAGINIPATSGTRTAAAAPPATAPTNDTLVLHLSEDAWKGDAQFTASIDGKTLGPAQSVSALHGAGATQDFTFQGVFGPGSHDLAVSFLNDAYGGTAQTDRNLYVNGATLDGVNGSGVSATLWSQGTVHFQIGNHS